MKKIVIIDDDPHFIMITETPLTAAGYSVKTATDGLSGITLIREWKPDLVIIDIEMPVMDGITAIKILRSEGYKGKIAVLTGHSGAGNTVKAVKAGASSVLVKPLQEDPVTIVKQILG